MSRHALTCTHLPVVMCACCCTRVAVIDLLRMGPASAVTFIVQAVVPLKLMSEAP
jgi:hypothetical protein